MKEAAPRAIHLRDYQAPAFLIDRTDLHFDLFEDYAVVKSELQLRRNKDYRGQQQDLVLDGIELELLSLALDHNQLSAKDYVLGEEQLVIPNLPDSFSLQCKTRIKPQENTSLEGLYKSARMFCTQCEAEGFRKITYYLDRPDVMSVFSTTIAADKKQYPVLLSNGNDVQRKELADGRHEVRWEDPFKKPCYLFALVAGDLAVVADSFTTCSGRDIDLRIFVEEKDLDKCEHAMQSLKASMRWDEEKYGREYDLDIFMIVAVDDFNMGAMENKGLNIFNTSCVLANPKTTTDLGFQRVEAVVAHEYFHNWSGNRVTCRDWFQLSLKEGFTVFRDSQFSADMNSPAVKRIEDAAILRTAQFAEDAGPMAHPIRPASFIEISNFYTVTVYEKGAEVVRMQHRLLGEELFRKGADLYFQRFDGQAVTTDDFVTCMEEASGVDLGQFRRWYSQAGTPVLDISAAYDADRREYGLTVRQSCPPTPSQQDKAPLHIPLALSLLGADGPLPLRLSDPLQANMSTATEAVLHVKEAEQTFVFKDIDEPPVPSLLRGFSAPVKCRFAYSDSELLFLMRNESDGFSRWDAGQNFSVRELTRMIEASQAGKQAPPQQSLLDAFSATLQNAIDDPAADYAMLAMLLVLPSEAYLSELIQPVDALTISSCRLQARIALAAAMEAQLVKVYDHFNASTDAYQPQAQQIGERALKNACLAYLALLAKPEHEQRCEQQFSGATNMTDEYAALRALVHHGSAPAREKALAAFYQRWQYEPLVVNQWLQVQATDPREACLASLKSLQEHKAYDAGNPNKLRALVGAFAGQNTSNFHALDGSGYRFLADEVIRLNASNPQIASRLLGPLSKWQKFLPAHQALMKAQLQRVMDAGDLSKDVFEVVSKSLAS